MVLTYLCIAKGIFSDSFKIYSTVYFEKYRISGKFTQFNNIVINSVINLKYTQNVFCIELFLDGWEKYFLDKQPAKLLTVYLQFLRVLSKSNFIFKI